MFGLLFTSSNRRVLSSLYLHVSQLHNPILCKLANRDDEKKKTKKENNKKKEKLNSKQKLKAITKKKKEKENNKSSLSFNFLGRLLKAMDF